MGWAHCCVMPPPTDSAAIDPRMLHRDDHINPPRPRGLDVPCARLRATNPLRALARCVQAGKPGTSSGHRSVPHTADLRIEAWAPTRDGCIRQAVLGTVESFLDLESAHEPAIRVASRAKWLALFPWAVSKDESTANIPAVATAFFSGADP